VGLDQTHQTHTTYLTHTTDPDPVD
jgi:hypothetical protein